MVSEVPTTPPFLHLTGHRARVTILSGVSGKSPSQGSPAFSSRLSYDEAFSEDAPRNPHHEGPDVAPLLSASRDVGCRWLRHASLSGDPTCLRRDQRAIASVVSRTLGQARCQIKAVLWRRDLGIFPPYRRQIIFPVFQYGPRRMPNSFRLR